jgi:hypothetical protein
MGFFFPRTPLITPMHPHGEGLQGRDPRRLCLIKNWKKKNCNNTAQENMKNTSSTDNDWLYKSKTPQRQQKHKLWPHSIVNPYKDRKLQSFPSSGASVPSKESPLRSLQEEFKNKIKAITLYHTYQRIRKMGYLLKRSLSSEKFQKVS